MNVSSCGRNSIYHDFLVLILAIVLQFWIAPTTRADCQTTVANQIGDQITVTATLISDDSDEPSETDEYLTITSSGGETSSNSSCIIRDYNTPNSSCSFTAVQANETIEGITANDGDESCSISASVGGSSDEGDVDQSKNEGSDPNCPQACVGNPINVGTGNKFQVETDYTGPLYTGIELRRYYNSQDTQTSTFGANWRSTWDRYITMLDGTTIKVTRADSRILTFKQNGSGAWASDPDVTLRLSGSAQTGWKLIDDNDNTEAYSASGKLRTVTTRAGEITTLNYENTTGFLASVGGPYGHNLHFHHTSAGLVDSVTLPDGSVLVYGYDSNQNLTSVQYPDHSTVQYIYNESANTSGANLPHALTGIIDGNGVRFATYQYDAQNRAISTAHPGGVNAAHVTYSASGSASVTDALGNTYGFTFQTQYGMVKPTTVTGASVPTIGAKAVTYDSNGFVASRTDFDGNTTIYVHDSRGRETSRTEASGTPLARTITTTWHSTFNLPTQITEPSGVGVAGVNRVTTWTYNDANGALLSKTISAGGQSRSWTYSNHDEYGHPGKVTGPLGDVTTITYSMGAPYRITNALGQSYGIVYDYAGRASSVCDPNDLCVRTTYTPFGAVETRSVNIQETRYEYDNAHGLSGITTPDGAHYTFQNDAAHQLAAVIDPLGNRMQLNRNLNGNVKSEQVFDAAGTLIRQRSHNYDAVNRLVQDIGVKGQTTTYGRDDNGDIVRTTDPVGNVTTYGRDALRRVTSITAPDGGVTLIGYNADDSIAAITDAKNNQTQYSYDGLGNQTGENSPDRGKITRTFDAAGNVATEMDGRGLTTTYGRDILGRVTVAQYGDGTSAKYTYDENGIDMYGKGRLTIVEDASGKTKFAHNPYGDIVRKEQELNGVTLSTSNTYYETKGQLERTVLPSGKAVEYTYNDKSGKKETIKVNGQQIIGGIKYEPFSDAPKLWSQGDGSVNLYHERDRDQDGNLTQIVFGDTSDTHGRATQLILYTYDDANRLTRSKNNDDQDLIVGYDAASRVTDYTTYVPSWEYAQYTYDLNGNRTQAVGSQFGTQTLAIDPSSNRLQAVSGSATSNVQYDAGGNLTQDQSYQYGMDARNKLARVSGGGVDVRYSYNGLGERVKKEGSSGTTLFVQDGYQVMGEYTATGAAVQETVYLGGLPVGVIKPGGLYYVNPDPIGSPLAITNTAGTLVWSWEHTPSGETLPNENPKGAGTFTYNLRFPGQYFDSETGAHYNNARTYLPNSGFYQQPDPIGLAGGINPYAYVNHNPWNKIDPWGLQEVVVPFPIEPVTPFPTIPEIPVPWFPPSLPMSPATPLPQSPVAPQSPLKDNKDYCTKNYEKCIEEMWGGDWTCYQCHFYCTGINQEWPYNHCYPNTINASNEPSRMCVAGSRTSVSMRVYMGINL